MKNQLHTVALVSLMAIAICGGALRFATADNPKSSNQPPAKTEVRIDNFTFQAQTTTIPVGTEVTWVNRDDIPHTVVSDDKVFKSKALDTDDKFTYTFTKPGTYKYFCSLHPKMTAEVIVN
jgi:plastocyanin